MIDKPKSRFVATLMRNLLPLLVLLVIALGIRLVYINELAVNPFFGYPIVDSETYDLMAQHIANGEDPTDGPFYQPPLYPYFLGSIYLIFGHDIYIARLMGLLLGVVNVLLTYLLARRYLGHLPAFFAGLAMALCGTCLFFEAELLGPVLIIFLNLLFLLSVSLLLEKPGWYWWLISGILLGLSALTMSVVLPFALVFVIYTIFHFRHQTPPFPWGQILILNVLFVVGTALAIAPVTLYNASKDDPVLISTNGGLNLYLGTGADFERKVAIRPGFAWNEMTIMPQKEGALKPSEQSAWFTARSLQIMVEDPLGYIASLGRKLWQYSNGNEVMRNQEMYPFRQYSAVLSILLWKSGLAFPYGLLFPFAILGALFIVLHHKKLLYPMLLFAISHILVLLLFFVTARYRMNIMPIITILAVFGVYALVQYVKEKNWRNLAWGGAGVLALLMICNWDIKPMSDEFNSDAYYNLGVKLQEHKKPGAQQMYEKALELEPDYPEANCNMGILMNHQHKYQDAAAHFQRVLRNWPDDPQTNLNMGNALLGMGDRQGAKRQYLKVLELVPGNEIAIYNLQLLAKKGVR